MVDVAGHSVARIRQYVKKAGRINFARSAGGWRRWMGRELRRSTSAAAESSTKEHHLPSWRELDEPARAISTAVGNAVQAADAGDRADFERAAGALAALPAEPTGLVMGAMVRVLLEDQHVDGIDSDDIRQVLARCYQQATAWLGPRSVGVETLVAVLSSALGIHEPGVTYREITGPAVVPAGTVWVDPEIAASDGSGCIASLVPTTAQYTWHASLLIADLLGSGRHGLRACLDRAFQDIADDQTMELP